MPEKCSLYIFNKYCQIIGPIENKGPDNSGDFWTEMLFGDTSYLQIRTKGKLSNTELESINLIISDVACMDNEIAKIENKNGDTVYFSEFQPGIVAAWIHTKSSSSELVALLKSDKGFNVCALYQKAANTRSVPSGLSEVLERTDYMKNNFPGKSMPDYYEYTFKTVESDGDGFHVGYAYTNS